MTGGIQRILFFTFAPDRAWHDAAVCTPSFPVARHLGVLALVPACVAALLGADDSTIASAALTPLGYGSPFAMALREGTVQLSSIPITAPAARSSAVIWPVLALVTYLATWLAVAFSAALLNLLLPVFSAQRDFHRSMTVTSYAATPLLLSSIALLHPSLVAVVALGAIHACYVAYLGLPAMLGVPRSEAGVCLGITGIAALVGSQVAGYGAGALLSAFAP